MARFDVHRITGSAGASLVVDVQADFLDGIASRAVLPLFRRGTVGAPMADLNPAFSIDGEDYVLLTQAIATVPARLLGRPVASLSEQRDAITRALDLLLTGF